MPARASEWPLPTTLRYYDQSKYFPASGAGKYDNFQKVRISFHVPEGVTETQLLMEAACGKDAVLVEPADGAGRQALADRVRQAQQFLQNAGCYQAQTVTALQQAAEKAQAILADPEVAEETVATAEKELQLCVFGLRYRA